MTRYWVIAPFAAKNAALFDRVWQFDLANNIISVGWSHLGDVSKMAREVLTETVAAAYPDTPNATKSLFVNMLWAFFHEISPGDIVIARRGRKTLAAVGKVTKTAFFSTGRNPHLAQPDSFPNVLDVRWLDQPRDKVFSTLVFPMHTLCEVNESQYQSLVEGSITESVSDFVDAAVEDQNAFVLEKYLEEFIVSNFDTIFKGKLKIYEGPEGLDGQQYGTDIGPIDILATEPASASFVVIELKKGRPSDQVVGQILRYMGWVKQNLCKDGQGVKGLVICSDPDTKLSYALTMTQNIDVRYYSVSFALKDAP